MNEQTDTPLCPKCGTPMIWHFWDGHNTDGVLMGGVRDVCPICDVRPRSQTEWGKAIHQQRMELRMQWKVLSERTGIGVVRLSDIEHGYGDPPTDDEKSTIQAVLDPA